MEQITFIAENKKDKNLLIAIAQKIGIKKYAVTNEKTAAKKDNRQELLKIIDAGADVSNFGNPSLWQKETRSDRTFNQSSK